MGLHIIPSLDNFTHKIYNKNGKKIHYISATDKENKKYDLTKLTSGEQVKCYHGF